MSDQPTTTYLSSPNLIASQLFNEAARQLDAMKENEDNSAKVASVIILIMAALESFLNSYFHQLAFQLKKKELLEIIVTGRDSKGLVSTKNKILNWPQQISGKSIDPNSSEYRNYDEVRKLRDKLVHYRPDEMKWGHPQDSLKFVPDHKIDFYKSLTKEKGIESLHAILALVGTMGRTIEGREGVQNIVFTANWSGRWPDQLPRLRREIHQA